MRANRPTDDAARLPIDEVAASLVEGLPRLVSVDQAADLFSCHPRTVKRWLADGRLRAVRTSGGRSGRTLIPALEIERLLRVMLA